MKKIEKMFILFVILIVFLCSWWNNYKIDKLCNKIETIENVLSIEYSGKYSYSRELNDINIRIGREITRIYKRLKELNK